MSQTANKSQSKASSRQRNARLAVAREVLQAVAIRHLQRRVDSAQVALDAAVSPAKLTRADGTVEATVLFGNWFHDTDTEESGPGIGLRIGSGAPTVALLDHDQLESLGPDIAPGDRVRLRKISSRRYAFIEVTKPAAAREPCNWIGAWQKSVLPHLQTIGVGQ